MSAAAGKRERLLRAGVPALRKRAAPAAAAELGYVSGPDVLGTPPAGRLREALFNTRCRAREAGVKRMDAPAGRGLCSTSAPCLILSLGLADEGGGLSLLTFWLRLHMMIFIVDRKSVV